MPFAQDFAQSCNTAFVSLARASARDLREVARDYGLGEQLPLGVRAPRASVPPSATPSRQAAAMIGQDRILASPLAMAGWRRRVAAAAAGTRRACCAPTPAGPAAPSPARERDALRSLMRRVVTSGTGIALRPSRAPSAARAARRSSARGPAATHAWFIAYRGDVAVAVLVENGRAGGAVAAPIAARFLRALPAG